MAALNIRDLALRYAGQANHPGDALVGVTGAAPARVEQGNLITRSLPLIEIVTVVMIALIVGTTLSLAAGSVALMVNRRLMNHAHSWGQRCPPSAGFDPRI